MATEEVTQVSQYDGLELWEQVCSTNPDYTKEVTFGRKYTAIDPQYQLKNATKLWGPYGGKWGLRNLVTQAVPIPATKKGNKDVPESVEAVIIAEFFYPGGCFPVTCSQKLLPDDDVYLKIMTHARSKALSLLGFNSDVYEGKFEDSRYVAEARDHSRNMGNFLGQAKPKYDVASTIEQVDKLDDRAAEHLANGTIDEKTHEEIECFSKVARRRINKAQGTN